VLAGAVNVVNGIPSEAIFVKWRERETAISELLGMIEREKRIEAGFLTG
jgi:hypothetical protein